MSLVQYCTRVPGAQLPVWRLLRVGHIHSPHHRASLHIAWSPRWRADESISSRNGFLRYGISLTILYLVVNQSSRNYAKGSFVVDIKLYAGNLFLSEIFYRFCCGIHIARIHNTLRTPSLVSRQLQDPKEVWPYHWHEDDILGHFKLLSDDDHLGFGVVSGCPLHWEFNSDWEMYCKAQLEGRPRHELLACCVS